MNKQFNPMQAWANAMLAPAATIATDFVGKPRKMAGDPVGTVGDSTAAAAAGVAGIGAPFYSDNANAFFQGQMERDPFASEVAPWLIPMSGASKGINAMLANPRVTGGAAGAAGLTTGASADGDTGEVSYSQRKMELEQQQREAFEALEALRREQKTLEQTERDKLAKKPARELQALVGAKVDGVIGEKTQAKIDAYIDAEMRKLQAENAKAEQRLQARYDTLGSAMSDLDKEYSPEAIRKRQQSSRIGELAPTWTGLGQGLAVALGLGADVASRGKSRGSFNKAMRAANAGSTKAAGKAETALNAGRAGEAAHQSSKASHYFDEANALKDKSGMPWNTVAGIETAAFAPDVIDYLRASVTGNSDLKNKVLDDFVGIEEDRNFMFEPAAKRMGLSLGGGLALGKLAKGFTGSALPLESAENVGPILKSVDDRISGLTGGRATELAKDLGRGAKADVAGQKALLPPPPKQIAPPQGAPAQNQLPPPNPPAAPQVTPEVVARAERLKQYDVNVLGKPPRADADYIAEALADPNAMKNMRFKGAPAIAGGAVGGMAAFDQALQRYQQVLVDLDGDGIPDAVAPAMPTQ